MINDDGFTMVRSEDALEVLRIAESALQYRHVDQLRKEILDLLAGALNAERAVFFLARPYPLPGLDLRHGVTRGFEPRYLMLYAEHYYKTDPFFKALNDRHRVVTTEHVISLSDFEQSEYYNDLLKPQAIYYQMAVHLRAGGKLLGVVDFSRGRHGPNFSPLERAKAEMLRPHIAGALERSILVDKADKAEKIINSICPELPCRGIIVVDETLEPVFVSEEARRVLRVAAGGESPRSEIPAALPEQLRLQCQALYKEAKSNKGTIDGGEIRISGKAGEMPVLASLRLVECGKHNSRLCLIRLDEHESRSADEVYLKRTGLTGREVEVAGCVCEGLKNREIGEKLFISEYTVENHLRAIYEKLGVRNRTGLVHKVDHLTPGFAEVSRTSP